MYRDLYALVAEGRIADVLALLAEEPLSCVAPTLPAAPIPKVKSGLATNRNRRKKQNRRQRKVEVISRFLAAPRDTQLQPCPPAFDEEQTKPETALEWYARCVLARRAEVAS